MFPVIQNPIGTSVGTFFRGFVINVEIMSEVGGGSAVRFNYEKDRNNPYSEEEIRAERNT